MHRLFAYGTLNQPAIQRQVIGRLIKGKPARLEGYSMSSLGQGRHVYPVIVRAEGSTIDGYVLVINETELRRIDYYEGSEYKRIRVTLTNGQETWVYVAREAT